MSKRHQANRRRTYGRRQHELHERHERRVDRARFELDAHDGAEAHAADPLAFLDARGPRARFDFAD